MQDFIISSQKEMSVFAVSSFLWLLKMEVFCWFGLESFFNGSAWEIFYKVLHFAPGLCWTNLKSGECVWSHLGCHHTLGAFVKFVSCGSSEYGKAHCKMQASDLESFFKPISSGHVLYDSIYVVFWKWHFRDEERVSDCQGLRVSRGMKVTAPLNGVAQRRSLWWWDSCFFFTEGSF